MSQRRKTQFTHIEKLRAILVWHLRRGGDRRTIHGMMDACATVGSITRDEYWAAFGNAVEPGWWYMTPFTPCEFFLLRQFVSDNLCNPEPGLRLRTLIDEARKCGIITEAEHADAAVLARQAAKPEWWFAEAEYALSPTDVVEVVSEATEEEFELPNYFQLAHAEGLEQEAAK